MPTLSGLETLELVQQFNALLPVILVTADRTEALMRQERKDHTLQPTALLHEAFVRLFQADALGKSTDRSYLFGAAARAMPSDRGS